MILASVLLLGSVCCSSSRDVWEIPDVTPGDGKDDEGQVEPPVDPAPEKGLVYMRGGRLYEADGTELALWGVNFQTCLSWEYNNRLKKQGIPQTASALKNVTDKNLEELKRLGVSLIRCHLTPADFTDKDGNLVETLYLDVLDYMIDGAKRRGMYVTLTFINHMSNAFVENSLFNEKVSGVTRQDWVMVPAVVEKSRNYVAQLLKRNNPYTGRTYADETAIAYWELVNEPSFYEYDGTTDPLPSSGAAMDAYKAYLAANALSDNRESYRSYRQKTAKEYVDGMYGTVRASGAKQPVIWSHNWPKYRNSNRLDIFNGVLASGVDGVSCCSYPGQNLVPSDYWNNPKDLTGTDFSSWFAENGYEWMKSSEYAGKAKVIYEFETFFNQSAYLYPVQALFFRSFGIQAASMWTYTMSEYACWHAGSHFLSLTCTPRKAASFMVAKAIFEGTPIGTPVASDVNEQVGTCYAISKSRDLCIFADKDRLYYSGSITGWNPLTVSDEVKHIAGVGNSPLVTYTGTGMYFIDEKEDGLYITLEPDSKWIGEPWNSLAVGKVTELDYASGNTLSIFLKNWGRDSYVLYKVSGVKEEEYGNYNTLSGLSLVPGDYVIRKK